MADSLRVARARAAAPCAAGRRDAGDRVHHGLRGRRRRIHPQRHRDEWQLGTPATAATTTANPIAPFTPATAA